MTTITGVAAGVPFTALPPTQAGDGPAPLIVTWHMLDAPRTDAAFAAALPMTGVPAWRVHLGMPMCGARMVDGRLDAAIELARQDALLACLAPFVYQAAEEFAGALAALRDRDHRAYRVLRRHVLPLPGPMAHPWWVYRHSGLTWSDDQEETDPAGDGATSGSSETWPQTSPELTYIHDTLLTAMRGLEDS